MAHFLSPLILIIAFLLTPLTANAESAKSLESSARLALKELYRTTPGASELGARAAGVLVFPEVVKGGFVFAAHYGNGVLFKGHSVGGYYNTTSASWGLIAGAQQFSYALFFMTQEDLDYLSKSAGWEIGVGPNIVVLDQGAASSISSTTMQKGIYAFFWAQKGLMGGLGLQGTKITKIHPDK
jgi:lipid-binding SYLF domain-containing protein